MADDTPTASQQIREALLAKGYHLEEKQYAVVGYASGLIRQLTYYGKEGQHCLLEILIDPDSQEEILGALWVRVPEKKSIADMIAEIP
jgi:hypothetical protein